jgi:hypothetical protein
VRIASPGGTYDSSPVRSAGKLCKEICPSRRDDRTPGSWSAYCFANTRNHRSSHPGRTCLLYHFPALRTGLLSNVPSSFAIRAMATRPGLVSQRLFRSKLLSTIDTIPLLIIKGMQTGDLAAPHRQRQKQCVQHAGRHFLGRMFESVVPERG